MLLKIQIVLSLLILSAVSLRFSTHELVHGSQHQKKQTQDLHDKTSEKSGNDSTKTNTTNLSDSDSNSEFDKKWEELGNKQEPVGFEVGGYSEIKLDELSEEQQNVREYAENVKKQPLEGAKLILFEEQIVEGTNSRLTYLKGVQQQNADGTVSKGATKYTVIVHSIPWEDKMHVTGFQLKSQLTTESGDTIRRIVKEESGATNFSYEKVDVVFNFEKV